VLFVVRRHEAHQANSLLVRLGCARLLRRILFKRASLTLQESRARDAVSEVRLAFRQRFYAYSVRPGAVHRCYVVPSRVLGTEAHLAELSGWRQRRVGASVCRRILLSRRVSAGLLSDCGCEKSNENRWPIEGWRANYTTFGRGHLILGRCGPAFLRTEVGDGPVLCAHTVLCAASHMPRAENLQMSPLNQLLQPDPAITFLFHAVYLGRGAADVQR
jgi:hypothetical protein